MFCVTTLGNLQLLCFVQSDSILEDPYTYENIYSYQSRFLKHEKNNKTNYKKENRINQYE